MPKCARENCGGFTKRLYCSARCANIVNGEKFRASGAVAKRYRNSVEYFWDNVDKSNGVDACWPWTGSRRTRGYGQFIINGKIWVASRLAYVSTFGNIPEGELVLHKCDNPPCCNPDHLFTGSHIDNVRDKIEKNRGAKGEQQGHARFKNSDIPNILKRIRSGETQQSVATSFGVHYSTISCIVRGVNWGWLTRKVEA